MPWATHGSNIPRNLTSFALHPLRHVRPKATGRARHETLVCAGRHAPLNLMTHIGQTQPTLTASKSDIHRSDTTHAEMQVNVTHIGQTRATLKCK